MTFRIGNVANQAALLAELIDFLGDIGWTDMGTLDGFRCFRAPGAVAGGEFFFYFRLIESSGANVYALEMRGANGFDVSAPLAAQRLISPSTFLNVWQNAMAFRFYGNNRRVIIVARCSTLYISAYAGCLLPFALPEERPRPFYIGGSYHQAAPYNVVNTTSRFIADPGYRSAFFLNATETAWQPCANHERNNSDVYYIPSQNFEGYTWPFRPRLIENENPDWLPNNLLNMRPTLDGGSMPNWAVHVIDAIGGRVMGVMDGVFAAPGFNRASDQMLTEGGDDYRLIQNIGRVSGRDFMAIREI